MSERYYDERCPDCQGLVMRPFVPYSYSGNVCACPGTPSHRPYHYPGTATLTPGGSSTVTVSPATVTLPAAWLEELVRLAHEALQPAIRDPAIARLAGYIDSARAYLPAKEKE